MEIIITLYGLNLQDKDLKLDNDVILLLQEAGVETALKEVKDKSNQKFIIKHMLRIFEEF